MPKKDEEKKKVLSEQKAMLLVTFLGGFVGLCVGGYVGHLIGYYRGFNVGTELNWDSILECVELGALHILDETGKRFEVEDLKKLKVIWD